jgi:outer membrane protein OmpA-like peptidoglycan-associated protein
MKKLIIIPVVLIYAFFPASLCMGQSEPEVQELKVLFDSARVVEANVFAPEAFEKAQKKFDETQKAIEKGKKQKDIIRLAIDAREYVEDALKVTERTSLSLVDNIDKRNRALEAKAPSLVPEVFGKAEQQFIKATAKVESGDVQNGIKEAGKADALYDSAELEAIKIQIMAKAASQIEKAVSGEAEKYAPVTLDKARNALTKCDALLNRDRYERDKSVKLATEADYEARHASNIAQSVRSLERNDRAWEGLMLGYERQMQNAADELAIEVLPFDNGPARAADSLKSAIKALKAARGDLRTTNEELTASLNRTLGRLNVTSEVSEPVELAGLLDETVASVLGEREELTARLDDLETEHKEVAAELEVRQEQEKKIIVARKTLNPNEGEIFINATNDIVLRLYGISFASGSSEIKDEHLPLLKKVEEIVQMFPNKKLVVEGHTDDTGERTTNMRLSEKRAYEVMQYLRGALSIQAEKINAIGYGPDKPIGTNTTAEGRAKNRRIDIIIMQ